MPCAFSVASFVRVGQVCVSLLDVGLDDVERGAFSRHDVPAVVLARLGVQEELLEFDAGFGGDEVVLVAPNVERRDIDVRILALKFIELSARGEARDQYRKLIFVGSCQYRGQHGALRGLRRGEAPCATRRTWRGRSRPSACTHASTGFLPCVIQQEQLGMMRRQT